MLRKLYRGLEPGINDFDFDQYLRPALNDFRIVKLHDRFEGATPIADEPSKLRALQHELASGTNMLALGQHIQQRRGV